MSEETTVVDQLPPLKKVRSSCIACHLETSEDIVLLPYCSHVICIQCYQLFSSVGSDQSEMETTWVNCPDCEIRYCTSAKFIGTDESDYWNKINKLCSKIEDQPVVEHCNHKWPLTTISEPLVFCKHCEQYFCLQCYKFHLNFIYLECILITFSFRRRAILYQFCTLEEIRKPVERKSKELELEINEAYENFIRNGNSLDVNDKEWKLALSSVSMSEIGMFFKAFAETFALVQLVIPALKWVDRLEKESIEEIVDCSYFEMMAIEKRMSEIEALAGDDRELLSSVQRWSEESQTLTYMIQCWPFKEHRVEEICRIDSQHFKPFIFRHVLELVDRNDLTSLKVLQSQIPSKAFNVLMKCDSFAYMTRLIPNYRRRTLGTLLHLACGRNSFEMVEFLIETVGIDITAMDSDGFVPLQAQFFQADSYKAKQVEKICLLMLKKQPALAKVPISHLACEIPLINVAAHDNLQALLTFLIDHLGVDVNSQSIYGPPIIESCMSGCFETFDILVRRGAAIDFQRNANEDTCLHLASFCINEKIVDFLLENYPQLNYEVNDDGYTPLQKVIAEPCTDEDQAIKRLMASEERGNIVRLLHDSSYAKGMGCSKKMAKVKNWARRKENWRKTVLMAVSRTDYKWASESLATLLEMGADVESRDLKTGWMVSHVAARGGHAKLLQFILENFKHSISLYDTSNNGSNILHIASRCCNYRVVKLLVETYKMDTQIRDRNGRTARDLAILQERGIRILHFL